MITISNRQIEDMRENVQLAQDMYAEINERQQGKNTPCERLHYWDGKLAAYKEIQMRFYINLGVK